MSADHYIINYGPRLAVKDRPHRELDTARPMRDTPDFNDLELDRSVVIGEFEAVDGIKIVEQDEPETIVINGD